MKCYNKVLSSHNIFSKSDFIINIPGTCIDCIFKIGACLLKIIAFDKYIKETINPFTPCFAT